MKIALTKVLCLAALVGGTSPGLAADLGPTDGASPSGVSVVVDDLFLAAGRCRRNPNCIAPRVMPIVGDGLVWNESLSVVTIPVDPRFASRYLPR